MFNTNPFKNIFGLDISDSDIRLAHLKYQGKDIIINSLNELPIPQGVVFDGEIKDEIKLKSQITRLIKDTAGHKLNTSYVNCVLPERKTFIKLIQLPETKNPDLNEAIKWEAAQHIPMSLDEMYLDWQIINGDKASEKSHKVLIVAAPKNIADSYTHLLEEIKLLPVSLETESMAITRSILYSQTSPLSPVLIIDLGGDHTNFVVYDDNGIQFSSTLSFSGHDLTKKIAQELQMSPADAEKAKIICGLAPKKGKGQIIKIITPLFNELAAKVRETENFYLNVFPNSVKFKKIILSGSGALLKNLDEFLKKKLNLPVEKINPLGNINLKDSKVKILADQACSFTTAIGLGLKNIINQNAVKSSLSGKKEKT